MLDLKITGGLLVDGTGAAPRRADLGISGGRFVAVGTVDDHARQSVDATDRIVAPGFIDLHTHYDAQAFWDSTLSPSPLHGVTTVFGGNCGFSIAPLGVGQVDHSDADYLMRMLARVEGMPLESLQHGVPWDWVSTADYFERLDGTLMPNAGFMVGHSALRRVVLHDEATTRQATAAEVEQMCVLLRAGLAAGGIGFSSTWSPSHNDHTGVPVPSRHASREEVIALCAVVGEFPGTTLEFIPGVGPFSIAAMELMADMSAAANRPLNWNVLAVQGGTDEQVSHQLSSADIAAARGGRVLALTLPDTLRTRLNLHSGFVLDLLRGWDTLMALPVDDKLRQLADPVQRARWNDLAQSTEGNVRSLANWDAYRLLETSSDRWQPHVGRLLGEIAAELGQSGWDTLAQIAVDDRLRTVITMPDRFQDQAAWARRVAVWRDHRTVIGASDAGAHLDMIDSFGYATTMLAKAVREYRLMPVEEAVHLLTGAPAALYGVIDRGTIVEGAYADVQVFDLDTVGPGQISTRFDLPGGAGRVYGESQGVDHVIVNGVPCVDHGTLLDARPGTLLRSGVHTRTVTAR